MLPVLTRVLSYIALPLLGALFAWLATFVPGVSWDAAGQNLTVHLPTLLAGIGGGAGVAMGVFAAFGNKEPRKKRMKEGV
jgi:hypothetical protein